MNSFAVFVTVGFVVGWLALAAALAYSGFPATLAVLVLGTAAAYLYVPWARLRAGAYERPSWPARFWTNAAFLVACVATGAAFVWMLARRMGLA